MKTDRTVNWMVIAAIVFGAVTILSGGRALFGSLETRAELGNMVSFVLWFNFLVGFVYILAETGLISARSQRLADTIALYQKHGGRMVTR